MSQWLKTNPISYRRQRNENKTDMDVQKYFNPVPAMCSESISTFVSNIAARFFMILFTVFRHQSAWKAMLDKEWIKHTIIQNTNTNTNKLKCFLVTLWKV